MKSIHPVAGVAFIALASLFATAASATVMVRASVEELALASDVVFLGEVVEIEATERGPRAGIYTRVRVVVTEGWLGDVTDEVELYTPGGRVGERAMHTHGAATFVPGERVVVFLRDADGALLPTGMSQGKWSVRGGRAWSGADPATLVDGVERQATLPLPPMSIDVLRARVRRAAR